MEHSDAMSSALQLLDDERPDEASTANSKNLHFPVLLFRSPDHRIARSQRMILSSPTLRVTLCWSRYSNSGMAYLRVTPSRSLNVPTSILGDFAFCTAMSWRNPCSAL